MEKIPSRKRMTGKAVVGWDMMMRPLLLAVREKIMHLRK
jgi:hypothetical protein